MSYIFSILSGILYFLSFPKFNFSFLIWICFLPLFYLFLDIKFNSHTLSKKIQLKKVILYSLISAFVGNVGILYWIVPTFKFAGENIFWGVISCFLLSLYCSIYFVIFSLYFYIFYNEKNRFIFLISSSIFWLLLEYIRSDFLSGFPWMLLGYSQYKNLKIIQIAEFFGVYGISFVIIFFNLCLATTIFEILKFKKYKSFKYFCLSILVLTFFVIFGSLRIKKINRLINNSNNKITVVILQGNIDQYKKWDKQYIQEIVDKYTQMVISSYKEILNNRKNFSNLVLYIWPESSLPGYFFEEEKIFSWVKDLVSLTNKDLVSYHLLGTPRLGIKNEYYNCAILVSFKEQEFKVENIYNKIHLVPFGEFVPFRNILGRFINVINELGEFSKGENYTIFEINPSVKFSVIICYESIFSELTSKFVKKTANFLVNITNDAWFLKTSAPYQHFSFNILRAVENRVYLFRSANTGISAVISPTGEILKQTKLFTDEKIIFNTNLWHKKTFYTKYNSYLKLISVIIFVILNIILLKENLWQFF